VQIHDPSEEELAVESAELGDVRDPAKIRHLRSEVALEEIAGGSGACSSSSPLLAVVCADEAEFGHDPRNSLLTDADAGPAELAEYAR
jgi:hypothetical protein